MRIKILIIAGLMLTTVTARAQADSLQRQINEQVWNKFIESFGNGNDSVFRSIHSPDLFRVYRGDGHIEGFADYFRVLPDSIRARRARWSKSIEFRFIERIAGNGRGFETGYYKTRSTNKTTGETRTVYGKFYVLLRKEQGRWKILMDADGNEKVDEALFQSGKPM